MYRILLTSVLSILSSTAYSQDNPACLPWSRADELLKQNDYVAVYRGKPVEDKSIDAWIYMRTEPSGLAVVYVNPKTLTACLGTELKELYFHKDNLNKMLDEVLGKST